MNLTNEREKQLLQEIALDIKEKKGKHTSDIESVDESAESFYISGEILENYKLGDIRIYDFSMPIELKEELNEMWDKRHTPEMKAFVNVCTVASMKCRGATSFSEKSEVSGSIYEF